MSDITGVCESLLMKTLLYFLFSGTTTEEYSATESCGESPLKQKKNHKQNPQEHRQQDVLAYTVKCLLAELSYWHRKSPINLFVVLQKANPISEAVSK